ncbi:MAG TPA: GNAT family N-acetyltransferase [Allocoleopsis sp.]
MNKVLPYLQGARTILRLADLDDVSAIIRYYRENAAHLAPFEPLKSSAFYTKSYWSEQVQQAIEEFQTDRTLRLFLFEKDSERVIIGSVNFRNFVRGVLQSCTLGYSVAEAYQGKGYMTEALQVAISYVFTQLNMHRITASYLPHNQRSGKLLKRLGFVVEGYAYDYIMINGKWEDHILTSLVNPNWDCY